MTTTTPPAFTLDTSGTVHFGVPFAKRHGLLTFYRWSDLSPFVQGTVEAVLRSIGVDRYDALAPETLARIIADCESNTRGMVEIFSDAAHRHAGGHFWTMRQKGRAGRFPPLTVTLGDDGKVRFA